MCDCTQPTRDERVEAGVMATLLFEHPAQLTGSELVLALDGFGTALEVEDAADRLRLAGLVHRSGELVIPSRPARHMHRLPIY